MKYINVKNEYGTETVDEFTTEVYSEKVRLLSDYRESDPYGNYYFSSRCCKSWNR